MYKDIPAVIWFLVTSVYKSLFNEIRKLTLFLCFKMTRKKCSVLLSRGSRNCRISVSKFPKFSKVHYHS